MSSRGPTRVVLDSSQEGPTGQNGETKNVLGNEDWNRNDRKRKPHQGNYKGEIPNNAASGSSGNHRAPTTARRVPTELARTVRVGVTSLLLCPSFVVEPEAAEKIGKRNQSARWWDKEANHCLFPTVSWKQPEPKGKEAFTEHSRRSDSPLTQWACFKEGLEVAKWNYFKRCQKSHAIWAQFHHKGLERVNKSHIEPCPQNASNILRNESLSDINVFL